ncbi:MAG TPA: NfeD family protein [Spirochaetota bacterium]|nr:NfeD family protein [Spirochaetota bacterium]HOM39184.1 NfeD family protein [Spirochaetota bacterium]HPQ50038.1 NfeD family protein [Spirochaetota bacterium]
MDFSNSLIWLILGIIFIAIEAIIPGFIIFWFGIGAIFTSFLFYLSIIKTQETGWLIFFLLSLTLLSLWNFYFKNSNIKFFKILRKKTSDDSYDPTLIGLRGVCISSISGNIPGRVKLYQIYHGIKEWDAISESNEFIDKGEEIEVVSLKGIKLIVKKVTK